MWKFLLTLACIGLVVANETPKITSDLIKTELVQNNNASTNLKTNETTSEDKKITNEEIPVKDEDAAEGSELNPINPLNHATDDESIGNFKYYFVLLAFSSLSVIAVIVFKALRLRTSRAELKYGRASTTDRSEVEPLGRSQWIEESSDENEDELFDINFLKNSRSQNSV